MKRKPSRELLDDDGGSPQEIEGSLADLRFVNRWFGGVSTARVLLSRIIGKQGNGHLSLLEVAAGSADVPLLNQRSFGSLGVEISITALDRSLHRPPEVPGVVGDALALPFADNTFDVVGSALFVHHLSPEEFLRFCREALRVARIAVITNDLIRHPIHLGLIYAGMPLYRSRLTRHDAVASVKQAYTLEEMHAMMKKTAAAQVEISRHYLFRMGVIAWKRS